MGSKCVNTIKNIFLTKRVKTNKIKQKEKLDSGLLKWTPLGYGPTEMSSSPLHMQN